MAQQYTLENGEVATVPATYTETKVKSTQVGVVGSGIITIIGEAEEGPDFTEEETLDDNSFAPDELAAVVTKYGSGNIVDAFRSIQAPSSDPAITGSVSAVKIVKTNASVPALGMINSPGFGVYAELNARRAGEPGNAIQYRTSNYVAEIAPATAAFALIPHYAASPVAFTVGVNGVQIPMSLAPRTGANSIIPDFSKNMDVTGTARLLPLNGLSNTITLTATAAEVVSISSTVAFSTTVAVGDVIVIPKATPDFAGVTNASGLLGTLNVNEGAYIVTTAASDGKSFSMTRINKPIGTPATASTTATPNVTYEDLLQFKPMIISNVGGTDRQALVGLSGTFNFVVAGSSITITSPAPFAALPAIGDYVRVIADIGSVMLKGFYRITAASASSITCTRTSDGAAGASGSNVVASPMTISTQIFKVEKPTIDGIGKTLEISGDISSISRKLDGSASTLSNTIINSVMEQKNTTVIMNKLTNVTETYNVGGDIALSIATTNASASVIINNTSATFTSSAGTFTVPFKTYKNLQALVDYINSQTGYAAALAKPAYAVLACDILDEGTFALSSGSLARKSLRLKFDASQWAATVGASTQALIDMTAVAGLPEPMSTFTFFSGGLKGGTLGTDVMAGIDACAKVVTNFVVPLFSRDATADVLDEVTDPTSTYEIDAINAYVNAHVIKMSKVKARKHRLAIGSKSDTYENQKTASATLNSFRFAMTFQDVKTFNSAGDIARFQPWMGAVIAAAMQAAAGYRGIVKKYANVSAVIKSDFDDNDMEMLEDALKSGLLILQKVTTGGYRWVSDQMSYVTDTNFVYNSLQAMYLADLMTLTLNANFDISIDGKSFSEMSAAGAYSLVEAQMEDFFRLHWIATSDDAPKGYKNLTIKLINGAMIIKVEVKADGLIYFIPVELVLSPVTQTA